MKLVQSKYWVTVIHGYIRKLWLGRGIAHYFDPPGKSLDRQQNSEFWHILTHFCIFDPLRLKISTIPPLCFMIYYIFPKSKKLKKIEIPKQNLYPPLGVAPRDPRVWPLEGPEFVPIVLGTPWAHQYVFMCKNVKKLKFKISFFCVFHWYDPSYLASFQNSLYNHYLHTWKLHI